MKFTRKTLALIIAVILCAAIFAACGSKPADGDSLEPELIKAGTVIVGISPDYPPYESINPDTGDIEGFDVDMMNEIAAHMSLEVEFREMAFDMIISALQTGLIDIGVSAFTYSSDRDVLFSTPYLESEQVVVVNADSGITSPEQLADKRIGTQLGTTGEAEAQDKFPGAAFSSMSDYNMIFGALQSGAVDAVVADGPVARNYAAANDSFIILEPALIDEENHIIVKNGNDKLLEAVNSAIDKFVASGKYMEFQYKWGISGE